MHDNQVRERLQRRRQELDTRTERIGSELRGDSTPVVGGFGDQVAAHSNDVVLDAIRESAQTELQQLDKALRRLEDGSYGRCESCGGLIGQERLDAVPYATTCVSCTA